mmetsp:Transcript_7586/g.12424  ORF Transcript_7586/g.12424 Transcript_7586/m.12424 type:complete len:800 (-) Transcript_7586:20-2419(-)
MIAIPTMHMPAAPGFPGQSRSAWPNLQQQAESSSHFQWSLVQQQVPPKPAVRSQLQQQWPYHVEATPALVPGLTPLSPDDENSRRRRRSRTPLQPPQSALRHASPYGIRSASPSVPHSGRCASPVALGTSSISRYSSPHAARNSSPIGVRQLPHQISTHPQFLTAPLVGQQPIRLLQAETVLPQHSPLQSTHHAQSVEVVSSEKPLGAMGASSVELEAGTSVRIGEHECLITSPLGMGSFGVVWAAECSNVGEVAVKEIICYSEVDLGRAVYEAQLLWMLSTNVVSNSTPNSNRIPAYVDSDMSQTGPDVCRVRLAMGRVPGEPLDKFLREYRQYLDLELSSMSGDVQVAAEEMRQATQACRFAHMLVLQLPPTMERISSLAYHRDVNAHNILISVSESSSGRNDPRYGLVDFGLAVDAAKWRGDAQNPGDWRHFDVGGDCRYWPASAWLQFEVGCYELAENPAMCLEYQTHLDLQGLGITALQVLVELLPPPPANQGESRESTLGNELLDKCALGELWKLHACWQEYWEAATKFWTALLETFRSNGDWNSLKRNFVAIGVHAVISEKLQAVRKALRDVEDACRRSPRGTGLQGAQALFAALLVLISSGEERTHTTSWSEVLACLGGLKIPAESSPRSPSTVLPPTSAQVEPVTDLSQTCDSSKTMSPVRCVGSPRPPPSPPTQTVSNSLGQKSPVAREARSRVEAEAAQTTRKAVQSHQIQSSYIAAEESAAIGTSATDAAGRFVRDAHSIPTDDSHDLFLKLSTLATKVVHLAKAMEKLELRDRSLTTVAAEGNLRP